MAKTTGKKPTPVGLSFHPDDATVGEGLFGAGPATATRHVFGEFKYPSGNMAGKRVTALLVTFTREGEKHVEAMTTGKGFKAGDDGRTLRPLNKETHGLSASCKMMQYMRSLIEEGGLTKEQLADVQMDVSALDGITGTLIRKPMEKGEGMTGNPSVLIWDAIESAPWQEGGKKKKKAKPADDDDEEEAEADEDEADEDDDEEEEKPKKKKKAKPADDDDEDDDTAASSDDEDDLEAGTEALIEALEDGELKLAKVETAVAAVLKKHKRAKPIAALMALPKTLKKENGWSFDGKTVSQG